jgi:hypothetical protein
MLNMRLVHNVESVCPHIVGKHKNRHKNPILHMTERAAELHCCLIRGREHIILILCLVERAHFVSIRDHFVHDQCDAEQKVADRGDHDQVTPLVFQWLVVLPDEQ